jgi:hypothetical protein
MLICPQEAGQVDTEELEREIATLQTKLNSAHNVNPAIIQQYENRREKVSTCRVSPLFSIVIHLRPFLDPVPEETHSRTGVQEREDDSEDDQHQSA